MTLTKSKYTGNLMAQCDHCHAVMDFDAGDHFRTCTAILRASGWTPRKQADGVWLHRCDECAEVSS